MKKPFKLPLFLLALIFVVSCGKDSKEEKNETVDKDKINSSIDLDLKGTIEFEDFVPKGTPGVIALDIKSIVEKGKLDELSDTKIYKMAIEELRSESKKVARFIEEVVNDPKITGLDFRSNVVAFVHLENIDEEEAAAVLAFGIRNEDDFKDFIEEIFNLADFEAELEEEDNYNFYTIDRDVILGWDDSKAMFIGGSGDLEDVLKDLLELEKDESIVSNKDFKKFLKEKEDISMWISTDSDQMQDLIKDQGREMKRKQRQFDVFNEIDVDEIMSFLKSFSVGMHLKFDDDNISFKTNFNLNEDTKDMYDEFGFGDVSFEKKLLNYFPKESFGTFSFSANFENMYDYLSDSGALDPLINEIENELFFDIEDILDAIGGNFIVSLIDFDTVETETYDWYSESYRTRDQLVPLIGFAMDLNLNREFENLIEFILDNAPGLDDYGDYYSVDADGVPIYFAFNSNAIFITNHRESIRNFEDGGYIADKSLISSEIASDITKNNVFAYLNINTDHYPYSITEELDLDNYETRTILNIWNEFAESIVLKADMESVEMIFNMKVNKGENSLKTIISVIDNAVSNFRL
tara:strand:+ start:384 stop:2120 length:1737 start_codon:yes stop_codon:yes gene_type:complete